MWKSKKKTENLHFLPTNRIYPNPYQARQNFPQESLSSLTESIARYGMLSPLTVREIGGEYELILGERRLRAAKILEMETVPCRVVDVGGRMGAEMSLVENLMREDLDLFEEAAALDRLLKSFHYTQSELAERLGQSQSGIANKIRLLRLSREERVIITENGLSQRHARALLRVGDPVLRLYALKFVVEHEFSVRRTEEFLDGLLSHPEEFSAEMPPRVRPKPKPVRRLVVKDVRLFVNSVDRAIFNIREAGVSVEADKKEEESFITYSIRIPKFTNG